MTVTLKDIAVDMKMQDAITAFLTDGRGAYEWRTLRRALRLMVLIRYVVRRRQDRMLMGGMFDWKLRCVETDGSITIHAHMIDGADNDWRVVFHVYDPVRVSSASVDETGWIITTDPHWLLASGNLDYRWAWRQIDWIFDALCSAPVPETRLMRWR